MPEVILVTDGVFAKGETIFRAAADCEIAAVAPQEELLAEAVLTRRSRAVIVGVERYSGPLYAALAATGGVRGRSSRGSAWVTTASTSRWRAGTASS